MRQAKKSFKRQTEEAMTRKLVVILRRGTPEVIQTVTAILNGFYFKMEAEARKARLDEVHADEFFNKSQHAHD
jgi:hypothetical protein